MPIFDILLVKCHISPVEHGGDQNKTFQYKTKQNKTKQNKTFQYRSHEIAFYAFVQSHFTLYFLLYLYLFYPLVCDILNIK